MRHSLSRATIARRDQRSPEKSIDAITSDDWEVTAALNSAYYNGSKMDAASSPKWSARCPPSPPPSWRAVFEVQRKLLSEAHKSSQQLVPLT